MRAKLLLLATIPLLTGLGACGQERPALAKPPTDLLTCAGEPVAPDLPTRDQQTARDRLVFDYILSLRSAWGDCSAKVAGVAAWAEKVN